MNVVIYDIETLKKMFLVSVYIPETDTIVDFQVSGVINQLDAFRFFVEEYKEHYWVGYNNLRFDSQVIEHVLDNYDVLCSKSWEEVCSIIHQLAQDVIDDANYNLLPRYRGNDFTLKQIDLFTIHHFDNKNRMVSLKRLEFEMDLENIEEMPIDHNSNYLSTEDINNIITYCHNDIKATYEFYKITIGDTSHPLYKGDDRIQLRLDIESEFGIPCLNYSDSKIGDEMIKKYYCKEKGIDISSLPKKGYFRKEIKVKHCIAPYIEFKTPQLKKFLQDIKKRSMKMKDEFLEEIKFYDNVYTFARGGIHTVNKPEIFEQSDDKLIIDWDVSSYYPAIIINNEKYPHHLGKEFLIGYKQMFERRLELKPLAKSDKKIKGIVGALKLSVNSVFGKSSDMQSWMYDRQLTMFTTITGELSLMMLIEAYELAGIKVISANTDGVTIFIDKSLISRMERINNWWCSLTNFELERTDYKKIIFSSVNDYLAVKTNDEVKRKGDFVKDFELYKNKSCAIVPIALEQWFLHNINISDTIKQHTNIFDFCIRQKASRDFHYEGTKKDELTSIYNKLIRYYISNDGEKIYKIKNPECTTNAPERMQVEAGEWLCKVCNYLPKDTLVKDCDINYNYYIDRAERIIKKIDKYYKSSLNKDVQQLTLW